MHQYEWDAETGGILLKPQQAKEAAGVELRPVYYREMNLLGMNQRWTYPQNDSAPIMWCEQERYLYRGRVIAKTKGGSLFTSPEVIYTEGEQGEPVGAELIPVDISMMVKRNKELMDSLIDDTAKDIYEIYKKFRRKVDVFYVAFSGGKDSIVALDMVQRTLPHNAFKVVFGDTQMEFPDTYDNISRVESWCQTESIDFFRAKSKLPPQQTWNIFGPPAAEVRWCCSVHKTTPQILLLRQLTGLPDFTGMAFTGIRASESGTRAKYERVSEGKKHGGQYSFHVILEWNSAELWLHILGQNLPVGQSYYKGIARAGCLVCPNSASRSDYFRYIAYKDEIDRYLSVIRNTSIKTEHFSESEMQEFIENGKWRTRRTGRELNFGKDMFKYVQPDKGVHQFVINKGGFYHRWLPWVKTIGDIHYLSSDRIHIMLDDKQYEIEYHVNSDGFDEVTVRNCYKTRSDVSFIALLRSTIIKALYCISCGVCEAECKHNCLSCSNGLTIGDNCQHCHQCHEVHERCVRYFSIRNKDKEDQGVETGKMDRYYSFGFRGSWFQSFVDHQGELSFWETDADGLAPNKMRDACHQFLQDCGMITGKYKKVKDKETKETILDFSPIRNTPFGEKIVAIASTPTTAPTAWALMLVNLVNGYSVDETVNERDFNPLFRWFLRTCEQYQTYERADLFALLKEHPYFAKDASDHMKQNVVDSLKIILATTPLGSDNILSEIDYTMKNDKYTLNSVTRTFWYTPVPEVILYALYKFAEACGDYHQFTLSYLMDESIERDGFSPTTIFGLDRETMVKILNGLAINYPEFINVSFSFDLDTITLRKDKKSADVLDLL